MVCDYGGPHEKTRTAAHERSKHTTWTPPMEPAVPTEATPTEDTLPSLRLLIIAKGEEVRKLRASGEAATAAASVKELLGLKARYKALAGEEYNAKPKRRLEPPEGEADDGASHKRAKQVPLAKASAGPPVDPTPPTAETFPAWEARPFFGFEVVHRSKKPGSRARVGKITTPHGVIHTPAFVPVGTNGALKAVDERQSVEAGTQLMFCNTYHLLVHPGPDIVRRGGGLHKFIGHAGPIITDSGGFQVLLLPVSQPYPRPRPDPAPDAGRHPIPNAKPEPGPNQVFSLAEPSSDDGPEMKCKSKTRTARQPQPSPSPQPFPQPQPQSQP